MKDILSKFLNLLRKIFGVTNNVDYMVSLPSPLEGEEELAYIKKAEQGDADARNVLVEHNLRLVVYIAKRFDNTGVDLEELVSVGTIGLIKAVKSYNSEKKDKACHLCFKVYRERNIDVFA